MPPAGRVVYTPERGHAFLRWTARFRSRLGWSAPAGRGAFRLVRSASPPAIQLRRARGLFEGPGTGHWVLGGSAPRARIDQSPER